MATQGERRALMFLAGVALLGAATRAWRSKHVPVSTEEIDRQIAAVDSAGGSRTPRRNPRVRQPATRDPQPTAPVDLDSAPAGEIERLPGIGPALARRIVADRAEHGPFGCLAALDRVKGIGPAMLARLDSLATFSAAGGAPCGPAGRPPAAGRQR